MAIIFSLPPFPQAIRLSANLAIAAAALTLSACSSDAAQNSNATLRVGDQLQAVESLLKQSGQDDNLPYQLIWANFTSGPPIIAAQTGGSLDLGFMAETPLVFAQAAGSPVKVVAVTRSTDPKGSPYALVVKADSPIKSVADLKGKKISFVKGTVVHYLVARVLETGGLKLSDIEEVSATGFGITLLDNGSVDAAAITEPALTRLESEGSIRILATGAEPITPGFNYIVASEAALADPVKSKAIGDFIARLTRAQAWQHDNIDDAAPFVAAQYRIDTSLAKKLILRSPQAYVPIDANIIAAHQAEADLFFNQGLIRKKLDASVIFDTRFNKNVQEAVPTKAAGL